MKRGQLWIYLLCNLFKVSYLGFQVCAHLNSNLKVFVKTLTSEREQESQTSIELFNSSQVLKCPGLETENIFIYQKWTVQVSICSLIPSSQILPFELYMEIFLVRRLTKFFSISLMTHICKCSTLQTISATNCALMWCGDAQ